MSDGVASPFSTGAGGSTFEAKVQAAFLVALIGGVPLPCLPPSQIVGLRFQARQAGFHTDDIVATAVGAGGGEHKLLCQVKHQLAFTMSDDDFQESIINAWRDYSTSDVIDKARDAVVFITGPQTAKTINDVRPVLEWARHCTSGSEFIGKVGTARFSSNGKRSFVRGVREIVEELLGRGLEDNELWEFLKVLHIISYDFDVAHSHDEAKTIRLLEIIKSTSSPETATGLWTQLIDFVREYNQNAGSIQKRHLGEALPPGLRDALLASPVVYESPSVRRLSEHTELTLRLVKTEFAPGVSVPRDDLLDRVIEALDANRAVVLTSEAGGGKSALAKQILDRLAAEGPKFVFRAEEFDFPHLHQALTAIGINESISDLSVRFGLLPQRLLLVEGVERLLEMDHQQAFHQLLVAVVRDGRWRVILTCRTHAANWLVPHVLAGGALQPLVVQVPRLSPVEVAHVATQVPSVRPYLENGAVADVLRTPFYLSITCQAAPGSIDLAATSAPVGIRRTLWRAAVQNPNRSRGGLPTRRERAFISLAVRRAKLMQPYVTAEAGDDEAMTALVDDGVVERRDDGGLAPAHDLFEDWAVETHVERCFEQACGAPGRLFELLGPEPALRRAFRHWLGSALVGPEAPRVADLIISACRDPEIPQHWRDETLVSVLLSPNAEDLLHRLEPGLLADGKALLVRSVHLLRTACKGPNLSLLQQMGLSEQLRDQLGLFFTRPAGAGWEAIIGLLFRHLESFGIEDAGLVEGLLSDWCGAIDSNDPPPEPSRMVATIALRFLSILHDGTGWHRDLDNKFIDILLKVPGARPDEVTSLFNEAINDGEETPFSRTLIDKGVSSLTCYALCRHLPDVAIAVAESYARPRRRRPNERFYDDDDFTTGMEAPFGLGRTSGLQLHPPSALTGPFIHVLNHHPQKALRFVIRLTNRAAEVYARSRFGDECYTSMLKIEGQASRTLITNDRLWCLFRSTSVGPPFLEAALMALEANLLQRAKAGENLSEDARLILESTNSVALVAVLASVAAAHPKALGEMILPLVSTVDFLKLDKIRMVKDGSHTSDLRPMLGIPTGGAQDFYYNERKQADVAPHRKLELETVAFKLQFTPLQTRVHNAIDAMRTDVAGEKNDYENTLNQLLFKRVDAREWQVVDHTEHGHVIAPRVEEPELRTAVEKADANRRELDRWLRLHNWAISIFTREGEGHKAFPDWQAALAEAIALHEQSGERDAENFVERLAVFASVASVVIRDHRSALGRSELEWCTVRVEEAIAIHVDDAGPVISHQRHASHGSRLAAAVAPLLLELWKDDDAACERVRRMISAALTHSIDEVVAYAALGARSELWRLAPGFAERCFAALLWQAQVNGSMAFRPFGPPENYDAQRVQNAREARGRMLADDGSPDIPTTIQLSRVTTHDLLRALSSVALTARQGSYITVMASILDQIAEAVEHERDNSQHRERIAHDFEFRHGFSTLCAETLFACPPDDAEIIINVLLSTIDRAPEVAGEILEQVLLTADRLNAYDRFWKVWNPAAERILGHGGARRRGRGRHGNLVEIILFASVPWKSGVRTWEPLETNRRFILEAFTQVGHTGSGFAALVNLLRTVGGFLLPEVIVDLNDARKRATYDVLEERDVRSELELVLRDVVMAHGSTVRHRETLRLAGLDLLDALVNRGSSLAFQLREILISPGRRRSRGDGTGTSPTQEQ